MKVGDLICLYDDWVFSEKECSLGIILDISRNTESGESSCYVLFTDGTTQWWYDYTPIHLNKFRHFEKSLDIFDPV